MRGTGRRFRAALVKAHSLLYAGGMYGISGSMGFMSSGLMLVTLSGDRSVLMLIL
jgi:hypothetical protein